MSIRKRLILVLAGALILTSVMAACSSGPSTIEIVETSKAQNKIDNATATAEVAIAAGVDPDEVDVVVGKGSAAEAAAEERAATATALAEEGITEEGVGSSEIEQGAAFDVDLPDGPALTGLIEVDIPSLGAEGTKFVPDIIKIAKGSTVRWSNARRSASSSTADPGQQDFWDSGDLHQGTFDKEPSAFEYTFNILGCFTYSSQFSAEDATGAVCVVEE